MCMDICISMLSLPLSSLGFLFFLIPWLEASCRLARRPADPEPVGLLLTPLVVVPLLVVGGAEGVAA